MRRYVFLLFLLVTLLTGCANEQLDSANAEKIRVEAQATATAASITAYSDKQKAEADIETHRQLAQTWSVFGSIGIAILATGIPLAVVIALLGVGRYIYNRPNTVYAGTDGQMPLVITNSNGVRFINNPNRTISGSTVVALPTLRDNVSGLLGKPTYTSKVDEVVTDKDLQLRTNHGAQAIAMTRASVSGEPVEGERVRIRKATSDVISATAIQQPEIIDAPQLSAPRKFTVVDATGERDLT